MTTMMQQAVLVAPGRFDIVSAAIPVPREGELLVRVLAVGVCGSDLHMFREGSIGGITIADAGGPFVPGHECMGRVEAAGPHTDSSLIGRRVFLDPALHCGHCRWCLEGKPNVCPHHTFLGLPPQEGSLRQYMAHRAALCEPLPDDVTDEEAVLLEPLAIAVHSIDRVAPLPGRSVAVLGCGSVGLVHIMLLARGGMYPIIATDVLDYRLDAARRLGATHVFNPRTSDVAKAVMELTEHGADYVFECAGQAQTFSQMVELAGPAARIGVVGIPEEDSLRYRHSVARRKGLDVLMVRRANLTFRRALGRLRHEKLPLRQLASNHWPLLQCQQAFETAASYGQGVLKAIVNP